jgi:hypothetical protein
MINMSFAVLFERYAAPCRHPLCASAVSPTLSRDAAAANGVAATPIA